MEPSKNTGGRDRPLRVVLAAALAVVAVGSLRKGKRLRGALAGVGALALGYASTGGSPPTGKLAELEETFGTDETTTDEGSELRCAICGQPIRPGQRRGPNEEGEIVHDACKESAE